MPLLEEYNAASNTDFKSKVCAALWKKSTDVLQTTPSSDPNYEMLIQFSVQMLESSSEGVAYVVRAMASQGLDVNTGDPTLINSINNNFELLAKSKDPLAWGETEEPTI